LPHAYPSLCAPASTFFFWRMRGCRVGRWPLSMDVAFALRGDRYLHVKFKDWLYAASVPVFTELVNMSSVYLNESA
jgi:hypothetical protein